MKKKESKYCGNCCWFYAEDTYGFGACTHQFAEVRNCEYKCNIKKFTSRQDMRHYLAVLTQHNRWRRSDGTPNHCKMVDPKELGKAIDFVIDYIKQFSNL